MYAVESISLSEEMRNNYMAKNVLERSGEYWEVILLQVGASGKSSIGKKWHLNGDVKNGYTLNM